MALTSAVRGSTTHNELFTPQVKYRCYIYARHKKCLDLGLVWGGGGLGGLRSLGLRFRVYKP